MRVAPGAGPATPPSAVVTLAVQAWITCAQSGSSKVTVAAPSPFATVNGASGAPAHCTTPLDPSRPAALTVKFTCSPGALESASAASGKAAPPVGEVMATAELATQSAVTLT